MGLVTWLSSKPSSYFPKVELPEADKIVHIALFATGAFFASGAMLVSFSELPLKVAFGLIVALISVFGVLDEFHQLFIPGRSGGNVGDWIADRFGAFCGVLLIGWMVRKNRFDSITIRAERGSWEQRSRALPITSRLKRPSLWMSEQGLLLECLHFERLSVAQIGAGVQITEATNRHRRQHSRARQLRR
jgi:VanZ family protein